MVEIVEIVVNHGRPPRDLHNDLLSDCSCKACPRVTRCWRPCALRIPPCSAATWRSGSASNSSAALRAGPWRLQRPRRWRDRCVGLGNANVRLQWSISQTLKCPFASFASWSVWCSHMFTHVHTHTHTKVLQKFSTHGKPSLLPEKLLNDSDCSFFGWAPNMGVFSLNEISIAYLGVATQVAHGPVQAIELYTKSWLPMWLWSKEPPIAELDHTLNEAAVEQPWPKIPTRHLQLP